MAMPAVALKGLTIMPDMIIQFDLSCQKSILAVEAAMQGDQHLFAVTQKDFKVEDPGLDDLYKVGTITVVKQVSKMPGGVLKIVAVGKCRGKLLSLDEQPSDYLFAHVAELPKCEEEVTETEREAMIRELKDIFTEYVQLNPKHGKALAGRLQRVQGLEYLIDQITVSMPLAIDTKQQILEAETLQERYDILAGILYNEVEIAKVKEELSEKVKTRINKNQREYMLREQMAFIREELGENSGLSDAEQFEEAVEKLKAGKEVKEKLRKEIGRFKNLMPSSSESAVERMYIETLLELPWDKVSKDNTNLARAQQILEEQHYGLEQVKERILEFLAVRSLTKGGDSPILCLVGPPGTGKTSIARSVAEALGKKYVRISLGGVRDEAEIRGHRRTYVGAMPGRIAGGLRQAGVKNPLMLLDEIDKVSSDYKGDTSAALLEVLDSEQNCKFRDHYVEIPLDLSEVLFIATANTTTTIPKPLLDRMELIEVNSYTANEKFHIAKEHLLQKQYKKNGMDGGKLSINDSALRIMIDGYTRESGVRELERKIGEICRKAAKEMLTRKVNKVRINQKNLEKYLGKVKYMPDKINDTDEIGIVRGLAWTSVGGDTLQIEVNMMPGKGEIELTGQMGDVMKESALTGISYVRSISKQYNIAESVFKKNDFHIHIPEGAVPKDGPSAGITMATAILSAITGIPVYARVAMTGEITLRGRVLPIGGLKEKILAAKKAGISTVLVPAENRKDVEEISREIKSGLEILFVETMTEVLEHALRKE
ncbi:MAG: endopeptidase La [Lachnospiraceae bacterium]|nr:endopeptidase La [Lachnospiraceae bacterium]